MQNWVCGLIPGMTSPLDCTILHYQFLSAYSHVSIVDVADQYHLGRRSTPAQSTGKFAHLAIRRQVLVRPIQTHCQVAVIVRPEYSSCKSGDDTGLLVLLLFLLLQPAGTPLLLSSCRHTSSSASLSK